MCAIFGSTDFNTYRKLYNECKKRGDFAYGSLYVGKPNKCKNLVISRASGSVTLSKNDKYQDEDQEYGIEDFKMFLGHTQAPTSSVREFSASTSHPFACGDWIVAHNGVLSNFELLKKYVADPTTYNDVDTSIIPAMIHQKSLVMDNEVDILGEVLSKLKGTFGLWIFCKATGNTYLARSGSTLYGNYLTNDFSSLPQTDYKPLDEGTIYLLTSEGITSVGFFSPNSPFLAL